ncbi:uncharacterized protein LOC122577491 isoform X2 [Bombus pyrosoma]|uniref:uncharacterized protein LOC122577491 isoform X2 n=1 Tax=Bombus pyrosoma TaxID=396416 RepID=UPI001CB9587F|nr:uncharacterized protein LOC122577491 isoform X2 [Bombus pyrosoma]
MFSSVGAGYVGYGHGSTCICPTCTRGEIPKMCRRLVKTIQMNVRRLTSLRRVLSESWIFSCVTAFVVRAIFSAVCSQYMERLRFGDYDLNGECGVVFVKGSLCKLSQCVLCFVLLFLICLVSFIFYLLHVLFQRKRKTGSKICEWSQKVQARTKNRVTFVLIMFDAYIYIYYFVG